MPILCRVTRGDLTESIHVIFATVVDDSGNIVFSTGDPNYVTCIRSSLKPFQAAAAISSGAVDAAGFNEDEIATYKYIFEGSTQVKEISAELIKEIEQLITDRNKARDSGDYALADKIRDKLSKMNVSIKDVGGKTEWKI